MRLIRSYICNAPFSTKPVNDDIGSANKIYANLVHSVVRPANSLQTRPPKLQIPSMLACSRDVTGRYRVYTAI